MPQDARGQAGARRCHDMRPISGSVVRLIRPAAGAISYSSNCAKQETENTMNLETAYDRDFKSVALKHDALDWTDAIPELEWDDGEAQEIASELIGRRDDEY
jgi:hypothetical protein